MVRVVLLFFALANYAECGPINLSNSVKAVRIGGEGTDPGIGIGQDGRTQSGKVELDKSSPGIRVGDASYAAAQTRQSSAKFAHGGNVGYREEFTGPTQQVHAHTESVHSSVKSRARPRSGQPENGGSIDYRGARTAYNESGHLNVGRAGVKSSAAVAASMRRSAPVYIEAERPDSDYLKAGRRYTPVNNVTGFIEDSGPKMTKRRAVNRSSDRLGVTKSRQQKNNRNTNGTNIVSGLKTTYREYIKYKGAGVNGYSVNRLKPNGSEPNSNLKPMKRYAPKRYATGDRSKVSEQVKEDPRPHEIVVKESVVKPKTYRPSKGRAIINRVKKFLAPRPINPLEASTFHVGAGVGFGLFAIRGAKFTGDDVSIIKLASINNPQQIYYDVPYQVAQKASNKGMLYPSIELTGRYMVTNQAFVGLSMGLNATSSKVSFKDSHARQVHSPADSPQWDQAPLGSIDDDIRVTVSKYSIIREFMEKMRAERIDVDAANSVGGILAGFEYGLTSKIKIKNQILMMLECGYFIKPRIALLLAFGLSMHSFEVGHNGTKRSLGYAFNVGAEWRHTDNLSFIGYLGFSDSIKKITGVTNKVRGLSMGVKARYYPRILSGKFEGINWPFKCWNSTEAACVGCGGAVTTAVEIAAPVEEAHDKVAERESGETIGKPSSRSDEKALANVGKKSSEKIKKTSEKSGKKSKKSTK